MDIHTIPQTHTIPLGSLVEVWYERDYGDGASEIVHACLYVVMYDHDSAGYATYGLAPHPYAWYARQGVIHLMPYDVRGGFTDVSLEIVDNSLYEPESLTWEDEDAEDR
jgi:hypothetical protein